MKGRDVDGHAIGAQTAGIGHYRAESAVSQYIALALLSAERSSNNCDSVPLFTFLSLVYLLGFQCLGGGVSQCGLHLHYGLSDGEQLVYDARC